ncbi:hypothetical protein KCTCHS21_02770 [Cohnella abietis]|uniref:Uncharacterized protein n=1 Tax=Cohnella abietis TaxID=2507935 RepID=A0A3T1CYH4_9BACL|nr:hypothetical protein KCTCHS21_02770 [Cohnella abietis]
MVIETMTEFVRPLTIISMVKKPVAAVVRPLTIIPYISLTEWGREEVPDSETLFSSQMFNGNSV